MTTSLKGTKGLTMALAVILHPNGVEGECVGRPQDEEVCAVPNVFVYNITLFSSVLSRYDNIIYSKHKFIFYLISVISILAIYYFNFKIIYDYLVGGCK